MALCLAVFACAAAAAAPAALGARGSAPDAPGARGSAPDAPGACGAAPDVQDQKPSIAVLEPVTNSAVTPINKLTADGALQQYIIGSGRYRVLDRSRTNQILKEQAFSRNGMVDSSRAKEIGKMLSSDQVCTSELRKEDGAFIFNCSLIDVESGEVTASAFELIEADTPMEIKSAIQRAVMTMLGMEVPVQPYRPQKAGAAAPAAPAGPSGEAARQDPRHARIAIVIPETHITRKIPDPAAETAITKKLLEAGFTRVVDRDQVERIRNSDMAKALMRNDIAAIRGVGAQLGVDYVMAGEAFSESVGTVAGGLFSCRARVEAKIFRVDNARIIATNGFHAGGADLTEATAAKKALSNAGDQMGDYMVKQLLGANLGASTASGVKLTVAGTLTFMKVSDLSKAVGAIKGVENVRTNEYSSTMATLDITTDLSVETLADRMMGITKPAIEITDVSGSAISVRLR